MWRGPGAPRLGPDASGLSRRLACLGELAVIGCKFEPSARELRAERQGAFEPSAREPSASERQGAERRQGASKLARQRLCAIFRLG